MSLLLVKDNANSKIRELECDSSGLLKTTTADVSSLATQATLSALNTKVTACDTGSISGTVAVSAVSGNVSCTHASLPLPSGAATESSLSAVNGKITACDTGSISGTVAVSAVSGTVACSHAALPLPSGAATEASLTDITACITANKLAVTSVPATISSTHSYLWGSASAGESVSNATDQFSDSVDVDTFSKIAVYGSTTNYADEFEVEVSHDNSNWFEMTATFIQVDYSHGQFGFVIDAPFQYIRLKKKSTGGSGTDTVWAIVSAK